MDPLPDSLAPTPKGGLPQNKADKFGWKVVNKPGNFRMFYLAANCKAFEANLPTVVTAGPEACDVAMRNSTAELGKGGGKIGAIGILNLVNKFKRTNKVKFDKPD
jgi:hypothetical protein